MKQAINEKAAVNEKINTDSVYISKFKLDDEWSSGTIITKGLNQLLADEFGLFTKTLNDHWNVVGSQFHSLHQFLESHYKNILEIMDDVAERTRIIGGKPIGTLTELADQLQLKENPGDRPITSQMITNLLTDHLAIQDELIAMLEEGEINKIDLGTKDFLVSILKKHEQMSWMLKSHLN